MTQKHSGVWSRAAATVIAGFIFGSLIATLSLQRTVEMILTERGFSDPGSLLMFAKVLMAPPGDLIGIILAAGVFGACVLGISFFAAQYERRTFSTD